jgi:hypothetical protein
MPMFEAHQDTRDIITDYEEPDVLISRSAGTNSVYIYYTDAQGIMLKLGENSFVNLKADGEILAKSQEGQVSIRDNKVYVGSSDASEQAVLGNSLDETLKQLASDLSNIAQVAQSSPYTMPLFDPVLKASQNLSNGIGNNILCSNTIVD